MGLKTLGRLQGLFAHLHDHGCARDRAGNRTLHLDDLACLVILAMFNPVARSLRALSQVSDLDQVRKRLGVKHASLGSMSEAARLFDPEALASVITELSGSTRTVGGDPRLDGLKNRLTAVDGSLLKALPQMVEASYLPTKNGQERYAWRLHLQFDIDKSMPHRINLTPPRNSGSTDEKAVLKKALEPGRTYIMDRWFGQFTLFNAIVQAQSDYVCRIRDNSRFEVVEERPLSPEAIEAGVLSNAIVRLGVASKPEIRPDHITRLVVVRCEPHQKRGGRKGKTAGPSSSGELLLATNLLEVPAEIIGRIYRYRWSIEIFFRFLKQTLGCRHLLWEHPKGILLETYCAWIACLLINQATGRKPTRRTYEMFCYFMMGLASQDEVLAHLAKEVAKEAVKKSR